MTTLQGWVTDLLNRHQRAFDAAFAFAITLLSVGLTATLEPVGSEQNADAFAFVLVAAASMTLYWRRSRALIALPVVALLTVTFWVADYAGAIDPATWLMFYAAARHGGHDRRLVWQVIGGSLALVTAVATVGVIVPTEDLTFFHLVGVVLIHGTAAAVGEALYQRSQYVAELEHRTAALEADLQTQSALAAVEERTRIAREMHDIVAHGMSAVVVQAQAGQRLVDHDPAGAREIFTTIEGIGRDSADEMRRMLGVLRNGDGEAALAPQPTFGDCAGLVEHANEAGVAATLRTVGHERPAPPGVELTGYRVIQEALTNVVRHAGRPVAAEVTIAYGDDAVEISVVDDGLGAAASTDTAGTGHGLLGMRERVAVYNGSVQAGPRRGGGYQVRVSLPLPARVRV